VRQRPLYVLANKPEEKPEPIVTRLRA